MKLFYTFSIKKTSPESAGSFWAPRPPKARLGAFWSLSGASGRPKVRASLLGGWRSSARAFQRALRRRGMSRHSYREARDAFVRTNAADVPSASCQGAALGLGLQGPPCRTLQRAKKGSAATGCVERKRVADSRPGASSAASSHGRREADKPLGLACRSVASPVGASRQNP